jgi:hypothetical protein
MSATGGDAAGGGGGDGVPRGGKFGGCWRFERARAGGGAEPDAASRTWQCIHAPIRTSHTPSFGCEPTTTRFWPHSVQYRTWNATVTGILPRGMFPRCYASRTIRGIDGKEAMPPLPERAPRLGARARTPARIRRVPTDAIRARSPPSAVRRGVCVAPRLSRKRGRFTTRHFARLDASAVVTGAADWRKVPAAPIKRVLAHSNPPRRRRSRSRRHTPRAPRVAPLARDRPRASRRLHRRPRVAHAPASAPRVPPSPRAVVPGRVDTQRPRRPSPRRSHLAPPPCARREV